MSEAQPIEVSHATNGAARRHGHAPWRGLATATSAPVNLPSPTPLSLPCIHLPTTSNHIEVLFESLLHPIALATGTTSTPVRRRQRTHPGRPIPQPIQPETCRANWMKSRGSARGLTTCAGVLRFTPTAVKAFPTTCCSIGETAARARQTSQGDVKALLN